MQRKPKRILLLAALLASAPAVYWYHTRIPAKPNILFIVGDDLGWGDVGWHHGLAKTPHMDKLVSEGLELDEHYVYPSCTPTRTALMSGRYPGRFGVQALEPSNLRAMPAGTITLASMLKSLGYNTYLSGKWGMGSRPEWGPGQYGFDHSYGTLAPAADPWTHMYRPGPYQNTWHRDDAVIREEGNATELVAAEAISRIREKREPWFLYVPFHAVHTPVDAPAEYKKLYDGVVFDEDPAKQDSRLRLVAEVTQLDTKIGQLVAALDATGQRRDTIIIFTSDNGGSTEADNPYTGTVPSSPLNSSNDPLRGGKQSVYDGAIRMDAFVNWPAYLKPAKYTHLIDAVDWMPTLAALAGYKPPADLQWDGYNQWPLLSGQIDKEPDRDIYVARADHQYALRYGDWKLIRQKGRAELYNMKNDPSETADLANEEKARVAELQTMLDRQIARDDPHLPKDLEGIPPN